MTYFGRIRSPETKSEVKEAANLLFTLGILFGIGALLGVVAWYSSCDSDWLIVTGVLVFIIPFLLAAGAYNLYYIRRMEHHHLMAKALRNPSITVLIIFVFLSAIVFGAVALLLFLK